MRPPGTAIWVALAGARAAAVRDGAWPAKGQPRWAATAAWLAAVSAVPMAALLIITAQAEFSRGEPPALALSVPLMLFLQVLVLARLGMALVAWPGRRAATLVLIAAIVLLNVAGMQTGLSTVSGIKIYAQAAYLPGYAGLVLFLLLDVPGRRRLQAGPILDAVVVGGAVACAGVFWLDHEVADLFVHAGPLQVALWLAYPLVSIFMITGVLFQWVGGHRAWSAQTALILAGLVVLALQDAVLLRGYALGQGLHSGGDFAASYSASILLIALGACGPLVPPRPVSPITRNMLLPVGAALVPTAVLIVSDDVPLQVLSGITLVAAALRMGLSMRQALHLSLTDELTGLANRRALLSQAQTLKMRDGELLALLVIDLDGFTRINNTLGHEVGDIILTQVATRLRTTLPPGTLIARLGNDEFAIAGTDFRAATAHAQATQLRQVIAQPIQAHGYAITLDASVGMALDEHPGPSGAVILLRNADIAMYQAKSRQSGTVLYHPEQDDFTAERFEVAEELRAGLLSQITVWYQPQVDAQTHEVSGLEALVRWNHPERGVLAPGHFLDIARRSGLMPQLTETVLDIVLHDARRLLDQGVQTQISFNVAPAELLNDDLLNRLLVAIELAQLPPRSLTLEITEDSLIADPDRALRALTTITDHQVEVSIDDYGSGYSSLAYLRDLPVHELKMDRSFVTAVASDPRSRIIVASTNQMAHGLGLRTVAEGVEDAKAADQLLRLGVDILQGYYFARPMPYTDLVPWLTRAHTPAASP